MQQLTIIGHGKLGAALGRWALRRGLAVTYAGRRDLSALTDAVGKAVPGAAAAPLAEAVEEAEATVLALPISAFSTLDSRLFAGRIVVDAMNAYAPLELAAPECDTRGLATSSEVVQRTLEHALVVKTLNHVGYHDLDDDPSATGPLLPPGHRRAVAIATDHPAAAEAAAELVDRLDYQPVAAGSLRMGESFEPGTPVFAQPMDEVMLQFALAAYDGPARHRDQPAPA